jgi:hypothetical protein
LSKLGKKEIALHKYAMQKHIEQTFKSQTSKPDKYQRAKIMLLNKGFSNIEARCYIAEMIERGEI